MDTPRRVVFSIRSTVAAALCIFISCICLALAIPRAASAQAGDAPNEGPPLFLVDEATTVQNVGFRFDGTQTFDESTLEEQIATRAPGFVDRVKRVLPLMSPEVYPFDPLVLQRDVARLRLFYRENGFLRADIGYARSRLDTASNTIRVVFTVNEGPPLTVASIDFFSLSGDPFPDPNEEGWETFTDAILLEPGDRYSDAERVATRSQALAWLRNRGYAFARIRDSIAVDTVALEAGLRFIVEPGPVAHFGEVEIEGETSVDRQVIVREMPFRTGDRFSAKALTEGQREVFGLNLFRTALADLPEQPVDSSVTVRLRVREGRPQLVTYRLGYDREAGGRAEGDYTHRNFLGGARTLTTSLIAYTGLGAAPAGDRRSTVLFRGSVAFRQPWLFSTRLSANVTPFLEFERDPNLESSGRPFGLNTQVFGLTSTLLYEVLPFRTISLQHTFSRAALFTDPLESVAASDRFNRSILTLSGTFGRSDDYLSPEEGVMVRPTLEVAGRVFGSGVQYYKAENVLTAYTPLGGRNWGVAGRLSIGRLWPVGASADQDDPIVENRFDPIRLYTGGGRDLRGWGDQLAGPKVVRPDIVAGDTLGFYYEPVGGLAKLGANFELRMPMPGLGPKWGTAVFLDAARIGDDVLAFDDLRYGAGGGLRYRTPVGAVRLDLAYKLNPDPLDLRDPTEVRSEGLDAEERPWRRFRLHLSIGQAF